MLSFDGLLTQVFEAVEEEEAEEEFHEADVPEGCCDIPEVFPTAWALMEVLDARTMVNRVELGDRADDEMHKDAPSFRVPEVHRFPWSPKSPMRHGNSGSASAPQLRRHPGLPPIHSGPKRQPDWKPVRRKQVTKQLSHLNPVNITEVDTGDHWSPPKIQGGGAWGGMLQAQHRRLAGVLAKQHKEMSNLQSQLVALQQLNRMGGHVGRNAQTDGTVHEYMAKIAPKFGRRGPHWQPSAHPSTSLAPFVSQELTEDISGPAEDEAEMPIDQQDQASEQDLQDRQDSQDAEDVQDQQDVQDVQDAQDVQDGQDVQDAQDVPDVEDVEDVKDETHDHAEQDVQAENDTLLSSLQAEQNPKMPESMLGRESEENEEAPEEAEAQAEAENQEADAMYLPELYEADLADLAEPEAAEKSELGELKIDDVESDEESISRVQNFFEGQAQASLREAGGRFSEENLPSINEGTSRDAGQGLYDFKGVMDDESGLSGSWMKEFQAASAPHRHPGRATAEVLLDNLNQLEPLTASRRSSGMCLVVRDGQGDFLGQIGAMEDPNLTVPAGDATNLEETLEAKSEEVQAPEDFIQAEAEEAELGTKEILLRGKDWSALAAECDALLQSCKRPEVEDEEGEAMLEGHWAASAATWHSLPEEQDLDLDL